MVQNERMERNTKSKVGKKRGQWPNPGVRIVEREGARMFGPEELSRPLDQSERLHRPSDFGFPRSLLLC